MQILGKRSKILLVAVAIVILVAIGVSFAMWDSMLAVKATNGELSSYANAKVGDVIEFGKYYQTGKRINNDENAEYEKTPIEWIVVDKDERTGQLTLMSKYILAAGSYFGNWYYNQAGTGHWNYNSVRTELASNPYNQAYVESTIRAYLNNLERRDLGGDSYSEIDGYRTSIVSSDITEKLYTSVGFSNRRYTFSNTFQRPILNVEYRNRPATRGFYDEAFIDTEKAMIIPKTIPEYNGYRWPNNTNDVSKITCVEGVSDKVWIASVTELNISSVDNNTTNPSDASSSTVFEYFKNKKDNELKTALKTTRTSFLINDSKAMNYSIPVYQYQSTEINEDIHSTKNSLDFYWTRSPMSNVFSNVRLVNNSGAFINNATDNASFGVRPCIILKY